MSHEVMRAGLCQPRELVAGAVFWLDPAPEVDNSIAKSVASLNADGGGQQHNEGSGAAGPLGPRRSKAKLVSLAASGPQQSFKV